MKPTSNWDIITKPQNIIFAEKIPAEKNVYTPI